jgi:DNA-binding NarL/FixJ family response regulator
MIKILIANKYFLVNYAIRCILQPIKKFELFGISADKMLQEINRVKPDIVIIEIDILRTNAVQLLSQIRENYTDIKIIVLLDIDNNRNLLQVLKLNLEGYIGKGTTEKELIRAINLVYRGKRYFSKEIYKYVMEHLINGNDDTPKRTMYETLTKREKEILELIIKGENMTEIASKLFISKATVLTHRRNIMRKLKVRSSTQLILTCIESGIIPLKY